MSVPSCSTCKYWQPEMERRWFRLRQKEDQIFSKCGHPKCVLFKEAGAPMLNYALTERMFERNPCGQAGKLWELK